MEIPETMYCWPLFGAGMDKLGRYEQPCKGPVPQPGDDEVLVKIEAIGLCFSDVKLILAGEDHPRVISENLYIDPIIPGHEAVMQIVKAGKNVAAEYPIGKRYIIQADIYVDGVGFAYGYAINGGMAQYSVLDQRVLNGDEGSYLLPIKDETTAAVAALMEPWTCVKASYMIENRTEPKADGKVLIVCAPGDDTVYQAGSLLKSKQPSEIVVVNGSEAFVASLHETLPGAKICQTDELPEGIAYDDLFLCSLDRATAEAAGQLCEIGATINFIEEYPDEKWAFDIGSIHYKGWFYQGTESPNFSDAYNRNVRSGLKKGGTCWLPGGAGAMGQMHTQLAVESPDGPARILISDMDDARIENVKQLLADDIAKRGIEFKSMNPGDFESPAEFNAAVREFAPEGFDDIVMLVPVVPVVNDAADFLKEDGLMNVFAGIPAGKQASMNVKDIAHRGMRYIGSSGSRTYHLRHVIELSESGKLRPVTALAAIGGIKDLKKGLKAVINADFPGKTVIFPNCPEMPLKPIGKLDELIDEAADTLDAAGFYTMATEQKLLEKYEQ
jgi:L-sorbose 1-phosphate reductase